MPFQFVLCSILFVALFICYIVLTCCHIKTVCRKELERLNTKTAEWSNRPVSLGKIPFWMRRDGRAKHGPSSFGHRWDFTCWLECKLFMIVTKSMTRSGPCCIGSDERLIWRVKISCWSETRNNIRTRWYFHR